MRIVTIRYIVSATVEPSEGNRGIFTAFLAGLSSSSYLGIALRHTPQVAVALLMTIPWVFTHSSPEQVCCSPFTLAMRGLTVSAITLDSVDQELNKKVDGDLNRFGYVTTEAGTFGLFMLTALSLLLGLFLLFTYYDFSFIVNRSG